MALVDQKVKETRRVPTQRLSSKLGSLQRKDLYEWISLIASVGTRLKSTFYYPLVFGGFGKGSLLFRPTALRKPQHIRIGKNVTIRPGVRLEAVVINLAKSPDFRIGNHVSIEQNVHIVCHHRVVIEDNVSITANCAIVDTTHPFDDVPYDAKVGALISDDEGFVEIGAGTFLGVGSIVLPNVRIGKGCVIGAHSVVTRSVPDYCVAVGAPAAVVRSIRKIPPDPSR